MRKWTLIGLLLTSSCALLAQPPRQDAIDKAIQAARDLDNSHLFEAAAARTQAREVLRAVPVAWPQFASWIQQVSQLYFSAGMNAEGRAVLQEGLTRAEAAGSRRTQTALLGSLADSWRQGGNLLKTADLLERVTAAEVAEAQNPEPVSGPQTLRAVIVSPGSPVPNRTGYIAHLYLQLAGLYQELGKPDSVAGILEKIRQLDRNNLSGLAEFYGQNGQWDKAEAIYREQIANSANPQDKANAWAAIARLQASQQELAKAIDAQQQAIETIESAVDPSAQILQMRQTLIRYMRQAGRFEDSDRVYQQLLQQSVGTPQEMGIRVDYANYLQDSNRAAEGESLLKAYLAEAVLAPRQKINVLYNLSYLARAKGDIKGAERYEQTLNALRPPPLAVPATSQIMIGAKLDDAQTAMNQGRMADAYASAVQALNLAPQAADGLQVVWGVTQVASFLAMHHEPAKGEMVFQRLFALARDWKTATMRPMIDVTGNYATFLKNQPDRVPEAAPAIDELRRVLIEANGPESGSLLEPLRIRMQMEQSHSEPAKAAESALQLLDMQEHLSGNTSQDYFRELDTAAGLEDQAGNYSQSLDLWRKAIPISDLLATPNNDSQRARTRVMAAMALAHLGQFDEGLILAQEGIALQHEMRTPGPALDPYLDSIRALKKAAEATAH